MNYINTRPPVSDTEIADLLNKIESVKTPIIDGIVLSTSLITDKDKNGFSITGWTSDERADNFVYGKL